MTLFGNGDMSRRSSTVSPSKLSPWLAPYSGYIKSPAGGPALSLRSPSATGLGLLQHASEQESTRKGARGKSGLLLMLLFLGTFDVHRRDWRALVRRMPLLRLGHKGQKMLVLQTK